MSPSRIIQELKFVGKGVLFIPFIVAINMVPIVIADKTGLLRKLDHERSIKIQARRSPHH